MSAPWTTHARRWSVSTVTCLKRSAPVCTATPAGLDGSASVVTWTWSGSPEGVPTTLMVTVVDDRPGVIATVTVVGAGDDDALSARATAAGQIATIRPPAPPSRP